MFINIAYFYLMERSLRLTEDGSHTIYVEELDEAYHSIHGALQESMHVFIEKGMQSLSKPRLRILEVGFGTGLNALLTWKYAKQADLQVHYHTVEKYPLEQAEFSKLNFDQLIHDLPEGLLLEMHQAPWERTFQLSERFSLFKEQADFRRMHPDGPFDLVYFDAFAPEKQPELWSE